MNTAINTKEQSQSRSMSSLQSALTLFKLPINNCRISDAVNWTTQPRHGDCRVGFFINAHSINLAAKDVQFKETLGQADTLFADGLGMRIAAWYRGQRMVDNVNGTDLFLPLCKKAENEKLSIYLLGSKPGVALQTKQNIKQMFPDLKIAGTHHGYFDPEDCEHIIQDINQSQCNILLVGQGSPLQESWLLQHKDQLNCRAALAVGGLFDYFSNNIPRAPLWVRQIGMEWVWRLIQEPKAKWKRYLLGNPAFLMRTLINS